MQTLSSPRFTEVTEQGLGKSENQGSCANVRVEQNMFSASVVQQMINDALNQTHIHLIQAIMEAQNAHSAHSRRVGGTCDAACGAGGCSARGAVHAHGASLLQDMQQQKQPHHTQQQRQYHQQPQQQFSFAKPPGLSGNA
eukprot:1841215-Amphidinium_carterae.1